MKFIYYYFGLGVLTFLFVYGAHLVGKVERRHARFLILEKKPATAIEHAANLLGSAITAVLVILFWPAVVVYAIRTEKKRREILKALYKRDDPSIQDHGQGIKSSESLEI